MLVPHGVSPGRPPTCRRLDQACARSDTGAGLFVLAAGDQRAESRPWRHPAHVPRAGELATRSARAQAEVGQTMTGGAFDRRSCEPPNGLVLRARRRHDGVAARGAERLDDGRLQRRGHELQQHRDDNRGRERRPIARGMDRRDTGRDRCRPVDRGRCRFRRLAGQQALRVERDGSTGCSGTPRKCAPLWSSPRLGGDVASTPAVANGIVYVGSVGEKMLAFDAAGVKNCSGTPRCADRCGRGP